MFLLFHIVCLYIIVEIVNGIRSMISHHLYKQVYNIEPSVVRHQTGSFNESLKQHETSFDIDRLHKWRTTLTNVAELKGYHVLRNRQVDIILIVIRKVFRIL